MISAEEARHLSPPKYKEVMESLSNLIIKAAKAGSNSIRVPYEFVEINGYSIKFKNPEIEKDLGSLGYKVAHKGVEMQFVDVWLEVSW